MKYLIFLIPILFLTSCSTSKLVSTQTESSSDTTIIVTPHTVQPATIVDDPIPDWIAESPAVDSAIAHKDTSQLVIAVHNEHGKVIGHVSVKPFIGQSSVNIQPDQISYNDTTTKITNTKDTEKHYKDNPGFLQSAWTWIKQSITLVIIIVVIVLLIGVYFKFVKKAVL